MPNLVVTGGFFAIINFSGTWITIIATAGPNLGFVAANAAVAGTAAGAYFGAQSLGRTGASAKPRA